MVGSLENKVALVTGASRGIGRGIALQFGVAGAKVYVTGRSPKNAAAKGESPLEKVAEEVTKRGGKGVAVFCDHADPEQVKKLFEQIKEENDGQLDILVNNAYAGVEYVFGNIQTKFYDSDPIESFELSNNVGLRNHYICAVYAARLMVPRKTGLIVTISSYGGFGYLFDVAYGISKAGCDRLASDAAVDLHDSGVISVSLWPGAVKTEEVTKQVSKMSSENPLKTIFEQGETLEYSGKCIIALANDPDLVKYNGNILTTSDVGRKYKLVDEENKQPLEIPDAFKKYLTLVNDYRKPPYCVLKL